MCVRPTLQRYAVSHLPEARFPGAVPAEPAEPTQSGGKPTPEVGFPPLWEAGRPTEPEALQEKTSRWSGRTTALVAAGVLALSGVGAVAAAAATPNGISAPDSGVGGRGGPGGPGGPGQGQFPGRGQIPGQGQFPGQPPAAPNR